MSKIETLTEDQREAVRRGTCQASGPKALRIIDAQAACEVKRYNHEYFGPGDDVGGNMNEADDGGEWVRYEDHVAALAESRAECERLRADRITELDVRVRFAERAETAEYKLAAAEAECERLRALHEQALNERDAAHNAIGEWEYLRNDAYRRFRASESKLAAVEAECERLRAENGRLLDEYYGGRTHDYEASERRANAAESKLAAAEALLGRVKARENDIWDEDLVADITAHLDGAAAPRVGGDAEALIALAERERDEARAEWKRLATFVARQAPARTEAEQQYVVQGRETVVNAATGRGVCQAYSNEYAIQIAAALNAAPARPAAPKKDEGAK
jgi:hypothetical protein